MTAAASTLNENMFWNTILAQVFNLPHNNVAQKMDLKCRLLYQLCQIKRNSGGNQRLQLQALAQEYRVSYFHDYFTFLLEELEQTHI